MKPPPQYFMAGMREAEAVCPYCNREIVRGEKAVQCPDCGDAQHWSCWNAGAGCASYECRSGSADFFESSAAVLRISNDDLDEATPLLSVNRPSYTGPSISVPVGHTLQDERWNRMAVIAFVVALLGIPLYGIVTGLVAIFLGAIALAGRHSMRRRGAGLALAAILLGIGDFVGWAVVLFQMGGAPGVPGAAVVLDEFEPDPLALESLPDHINRAMKANVLIQVQAGAGGLWGSSIGSGVILEIANRSALIVTNRHVVDTDFPASGTDPPDPADANSGMLVKLIGQSPEVGEVVWLAPDGVDLALIRVPVTSPDALTAWWQTAPNVTVGDRVFAIGNPHGLGWTHTGGDVSQLRRQNFAGRNLQVIQTSAAINPGNSGGGLYDSEGHLIGINTWTQDKRFAEGLGFAITFHELLKLAPVDLALPDSQLKDDTP